MKVIPVHRTIIKEALKAEGLPNNYKFLGYALHLYDQDEFVASFKADKDGQMSLMSFCRRPENALIVKNHNKARRIATYSKHEAVVVMLIDIGERYLIMRIDELQS